MSHMLIILSALTFTLVAGTAFAGELPASLPRPNAELPIKPVPTRTSAASRAARSQVRGSLRLAGETLYTITNPEKATGHEGHTVKVTGKTDIQQRR